MQPAIFLSWDGEIYGPATEEEVKKGLRTSWFEEGTLYWHEGMGGWMPVAEFDRHGQEEKPDWRARKVDSAPRAPRLPPASRDLTSDVTAKEPRVIRSRTRRTDLRGRAIFFAIALLVILLTIGILLLLMQI